MVRLHLRPYFPSDSNKVHEGNAILGHQAACCCSNQEGTGIWTLEAQPPLKRVDLLLNQRAQSYSIYQHGCILSLLENWIGLVTISKEETIGL